MADAKQQRKRKGQKRWQSPWNRGQPQHQEQEQCVLEARTDRLKLHDTAIMFDCVKLQVLVSDGFVSVV